MKVYDVIVAGGGSAGLIAALASARSGAHTLLIEETSNYGGTNTHSLVGPLVPFIGEDKRQIVDGIPQEIIDDLIAIGGAIGHVDDPIDFAYGLTPVDFKALQLVQAEKVRQESNLEVVLSQSIIHVNVETREITYVMTQDQQGNHHTYYGKQIIDATGDADVTRLAGCDVNFGRESDSKAQPMTMCFNVGNVDLERVRDDVRDNPDNFVVSDAIKDGKRMGYVAISGYFNEVRHSTDFPIQRDRLLFFQGAQENEVGVNTTRILNYSSLIPEEYQKATQEAHHQVFELFKWLKDTIPAFKNAYIKDIGTLGVRESVHIVGRKQLNEKDVLTGSKQDKSIAVGCYPIDIHSPDSNIMEFLEDNVLRNFEIDLDMLLPQSIDNLMVVGRPISATHAAHAASRVSVTCMAMGQSAGIIAAMASRMNMSPSNLEYNDIKNEIRAMGGIVDR